MSDQFPDVPVDLEPERYEFSEPAAYSFDVDRRDFLRTLGGGIAVLLVVRHAPAQQESGRGGRGQGDATPTDLGAWLHIDERGAVTGFTGKTEVGQNIRTSLTQAIAEELRAPAGSITLVMADTARTPYDQGTFGSRTTPTMNLQLRRVAAAAREMLIDLAASRWSIDRASIDVVDGKVVDRGGSRSASFGELTNGQKLVRTIDAKAALTPAAKWTVAGTAVPKVNGRDIVTGQHRFTPDLHPVGMVHGKVVRPAAYGSTLKSVDTTAASKIRGAVVVRDGEFLGVTAPDPATAAAATAALRVEWTTTPQVSSRELFAYLKANQESGGGGGRGGGARNTGDVEPAFAASELTIERSYTVAYIAHVPLEPRAAVAEWTNDALIVWTGTQRPFGVRAELMEAFRLPAERVRVIVPDTGSGYGGKHSGEMAVEAARLAKAARRPVKLVWTREEEFAWAYFRPAGVIDVKSAARKDGTVTAWDFHNYNSGSAGIATPYAIANQRIQFHATKSPLRQGSYRGLAATANHFAREVHMDEIARTLKMDPVEFRRHNLSDARMRAVVDAAAEKLGWKGASAEPRGTGVGVACGLEKGGYVACCAEVAVDRATGKVKVLRVVTAFECGAIVNPDGLRNQVEGAVVQGLGGALFEAIEFENGRLTNGRLSQYRVPRFSDVPPMECVLLDRRDLPSAGAGETPIVGLAPAIANAIFDASGVRLRSLPLVPTGLARSTSDDR